jgi:hypothetical protein
MSNLHFDPHQFAGRRGAYAASAETSISFADYGRMHTETHRGIRPWCPPFALNDSQLQQVLLLRAWRYTHNRGIPAAADRDKINRRATALALRGNVVSADVPQIQREIVEKHRAAVRRAGGFLQLHAAIAFRSWRLGMDSVEVAESLGMTPWSVRQSLWRLRAVAKLLGFDVGRAGHSAGMKRKHKRKCRA